MNREILTAWINEALSMKPGESMFLPGESREHTKSLVITFRRELRALREIEPLKAEQLQINHAIRDSLYWVELKRVFGNPLVGFKKGKDGATIKVTINDPERKRRLSLMKEDGLKLSEVEAIEGELSEEEREIFG